MNLQESFAEFSKLTGVRQVVFLQNSKHKVETIMWILISALTTYIALHTCCTFIQNYLSETTSTTASFSRMSNISLLYNPVSCLEIDLQFLSLNSLKSPGNFSEFPQNFLLEVVKNWSQITSQEFQMINFPTRKKLDPLEDFPLELLNIKALQYWHEGAVWLCKIIALTVVSGNLAHNGGLKYVFDPCVVPNMMWLGARPFDIGPDQLCIKLPTSELQFHKPMDHIKISFNSENLQGSNQSNKFQSLFMIDFDGNRVKSGIKGQLQVPTGKLTKINIVPFGYHKIRKRNTRSCESSITEVDCMGMCHTKFFQNHCGCYLLSWNPLNSKFLEASLCVDHHRNDFIENCAKKLLKGADERQLCANHCPKFCVNLLFNYVKDKLTKTAYEYAIRNTDDNQTVVVLELSTLDTVVLEEVLMLESSTLFARIGSTLCLWLGISAITLYHAIFFWVRLLTEKLKNFI